jgi:hypothetical protein
MTTLERPRETNLSALAIATLLNMIWVNASEVFRYFVFVMPMMREALAVVPNVAPMNFPVFMIWGVWDTIVVLAITLASWLIFERFGSTKRVAVLTGTAVWAAIFVVLWLGLYNMNLATAKILAVALPMAWVEMVVAALITRYQINK